MIFVIALLAAFAVLAYLTLKQIQIKTRAKSEHFMRIKHKAREFARGAAFLAISIFVVFFSSAAIWRP